MKTTQSTLSWVKPKRKTGTRSRQKRFLAALKRNYGYRSKALREANIPLRTYYNWCSTDEGFRKRIMYLHDEFHDFAMEKLLAKVEEGNTAATIFLAKRLLKNRGYH